jgi:protein phosphatase
MSIPKASAKTHTGNVRAGNEDCFFCDDTLGLWLVADGMGGHEAGEVASAIVTQVIADEIRDNHSLSDAIQRSHRSILDATEQGHGAHGMGSTVVAVRRTEPGHWQLGWVGDSRAYLWTKQNDDGGELQQISRDHSYVQALLDSGAITEEEMENHPERNVITQCLGSVEIKNVRVDIVEGDWKPKQTILLCSDGLSDELSDARIASILNENPDRSTAVDKLIEAALQNGGRDNVTVVLISAPEINSETNKPAKKAAAVKHEKIPSHTDRNKKLKLIIGISAACLLAVAIAGILIHYFG